MIRLKAYTDHGIYPSFVGEALDALPNYSKWSKAVISEESVTYVFDAPAAAEGAQKKIAKLKAEKK